MSIWGTTELFVGNLPAETTDDELTALFRDYGRVEESWVAQKGKKTAFPGGKGAGFGVVRMSTHSEAHVARKSLHNTTFKGKVISVRWAENQRALWVGSLGPNVTNEVLEAAFSQFGPLVSAVVVADSHKNASAGYGFVVFDDKKDAQKALNQCTNELFLVGGSAGPIRVAHATSEDAEVGYTLEMFQSVKRARHTEQLPGTSHFAQPGTNEYNVAMRLRQLQLEYTAAKEKLKLQLAQLQGQAIMQTPQVGSLMATVESTPLSPPPMYTGPTHHQERPTMGHHAIPPPISMLPPGGAGGRDSYHHVPPPRKLRSDTTYERFNPRPHHDHPQYPAPAAAPHTAPPSARGGGGGGGLRFVSAGSLSTSTSATITAAPAAASQQQPAAAAAPVGTESASAATAPQRTADTEATAAELMGVVPGAKAPGSHDHKGLGFSGPAPATGPTTTAAPQSSYPPPSSAYAPDVRQPPSGLYPQSGGPSQGSAAPRLPRYEGGRGGNWFSDAGGFDGGQVAGGGYSAAPPSGFSGGRLSPVSMGPQNGAFIPPSFPSPTSSGTAAPQQGLYNPHGLNYGPPDVPPSHGLGMGGGFSAPPPDLAGPGGMGMPPSQMQHMGPPPGQSLMGPPPGAGGWGAPPGGMPPPGPLGSGQGGYGVLPTYTPYS